MKLTRVDFDAPQLFRFNIRLLGWAIRQNERITSNRGDIILITSCRFILESRTARRHARVGDVSSKSILCAEIASSQEQADQQRCLFMYFLSWSFSRECLYYLLYISTRVINYTCTSLEEKYAKRRKIVDL